MATFLDHAEAPVLAPDRPSGVRHIVTPVPRDAWAQVLAADPGATALQTPQYFSAILTATGGRDASRLYVLDDGRRLVLPLVRQGAVGGVARYGDFPAGCGHGSLLATGGLRAEDARLVVSDLQGLGLTVRIGGGHHTADAWAAASSAGAIQVPREVSVIDLSAGWEQVLNGKFRRSFRQNIRRAERFGVVVERDTTGRLMPVFFQLYRDWVESWITRSGLPAPLARWSALRQEPYRKFAAVAAAMGDKCRVFIASHEGRPVASCITFVHGEHAIGWRSYSIKALAGPVQANTLVQALGIKDAAESGCRWFDVGQSGDSANLRQYKSSLGSEARTVIDLRIEPAWLTRGFALKERVEDRAATVLSRGSEHARAH